MATTEAEDSLSSYPDVFEVFCDSVLSYEISSVIVTCLLLFFGLLLNILLFYVIFCQDNLRKCNHVFLTHLAVASFLYMMSYGPLAIEMRLKPCWHLGSGLCKFIFTTTTTLSNAFVFFLIIFAYQEIDFNRGRFETFYNRTELRKAIACIAVWTCALVFAIPEMAVTDVRESFGPQFCVYNLKTAMHLNILMAKVSFFEFLLPLICLAIIVPVVCYFRGFKRLESSAKSDNIKVPADSFWLIVFLSLSYFVASFPIFLKRYMESLHRGQGQFQGNQAAVWGFMRRFAEYVHVLHVALVPILILIFSYDHRQGIRDVYQIKVATIIGRGWEGHQQHQLVEEEEEPK